MFDLDFDLLSFGVVYRGTREDCHKVALKGGMQRYRIQNILDFPFYFWPFLQLLTSTFFSFGVVYHGTREDCHEVAVKGEMQRYKVHHVLDFDPTRKRMSVIVEDPKGQFMVMVKGKGA